MKETIIQYLISTDQMQQETMINLQGIRRRVIFKSERIDDRFWNVFMKIVTDVFPYFEESGFIDSKTEIWYDAPEDVKEAYQKTGCQFQQTEEVKRTIKKKLQTRLSVWLDEEGLLKEREPYEWTAADQDTLYQRICKGETFDEIEYPGRFFSDSVEDEVEALLNPIKTEKDKRATGMVFSDTKIFPRYIRSSGSFSIRASQITSLIITYEQYPDELIDHMYRQVVRYGVGEKYLKDILKGRRYQEEYQKLLTEPTHPVWQRKQIIEGLKRYNPAKVQVTVLFGEERITYFLPGHLLNLKKKALSYHFPRNVMQDRDRLLPKEAGMDIPQTAIIRVACRQGLLYDRDKFMKTTFQ